MKKASDAKKEVDEMISKDRSEALAFVKAECKKAIDGAVHNKCYSTYIIFNNRLQVNIARDYLTSNGYALVNDGDNQHKVAFRWDKSNETKRS